MDLATRGVNRTDRSTWTEPVIRLDCPEGGPFVAAGTAQVLWEAYDQLLGEGTWWKRQGLGGTIPVRFPSEADPGDAGWHIDGSFDGPTAATGSTSRARRAACSCSSCSPMWTSGARPRGSSEAHTSTCPASWPPQRGWRRLRARCASSPRVDIQARADPRRRQGGDVYICHPFLVHAASWPHRGAHARMIAQPGVGIPEPFALRAGIGVCPVEAAILLGLRDTPAATS